MTWTWDLLAFAFAGAFLTGIINALAGNGSVITLSILTEVLGMPGNLANGTNRIGVLMNSIGAFTGFLGKRDVKYKTYWSFIWPVIVGSVVGTFVATQVTSDQFMLVFKVLMVVMLFVVLVNPERWLISQAGRSNVSPWLLYPILLALGFYGGFIQMGMGVFYLAILVLITKLPIIESNMVKAIAVGLFSIISVILFGLANQIHWGVGLLMGSAQFIGGWLAAHYASRFREAAKVAYGILLIAIAISILKLFNVF